MKIKFYNQTIEYNISFLYDENKDIVKISINFPSSFALENEKCIDKLKNAILRDHDDTIYNMNKVAKDAAVNLVKLDVDLKFEAPMFFNSLNLGNNPDSFFFYSGLKLDKNCKTNINLEPKDANVEEQIRVGKPFGLIGKRS